MAENKTNHCKIIIGSVILLLLLLLGYTHYEIAKSNDRLEEIEYLDSLNTYHKIYYEGEIKDLKKINKELYDSLKKNKDKIDFLVQFTSNQEYHTGKVIIKKEYIRDTLYLDSIKNSKTFEYTNVNPNDTMQYNLKINSPEEPNWYSLDIKTSTQYTIVNKEYANGQNHITIGDNGHNAEITDVTVFKKDKSSFWSKFSIGPSVTAGYDLVNKQWGAMAGISITYSLGKKR